MRAARIAAVLLLLLAVSWALRAAGLGGGPVAEPGSLPAAAPATGQPDINPPQAILGDASHAQDQSVHGRPGALPVVSDRALARAYAAVGLAEAGDSRALDHLDAAARDRLEDARMLLREGTLVQRAVPGAVSAGAASTRGAGTGANASATPMDGALRLDLPSAVDPATALRETANGPLLVQPGLWAKTSFDPQRQHQLVVTDGCNGGYAIAIYAQDFSTIRLDGGLVVPGRYYQVDGSSVITGASGCSVDIRPLAALPVYATAPARPPQSNG